MKRPLAGHLAAFAPAGASWFAAALALVAGMARPARADSTPSLAACVQEVVGAARSQGARLYSEPVVQFLLPGDQRVFSYALPRDGCFGVLGLGHRQVHRLGLTFYSPSGRILARDSGQDAHAYAQICGEAGRPLIAEVRMLDGEGEVHVVPLWNAPESITGIERAIQACMHAGTPRPSPMDVGPEPAGPPINSELASVAAQLEALGYAPVGQALMGTLPEQSQHARRVLLEGGHCYALAAIGEPSVEDIDLRLLVIKDQPILIAGDTTRRRNAIVKSCPTETGVYLLDVRMFRGGGGYAVQAFGLTESGTAPPPGIEAETRIPFAEMTALLAQRGMTPEPLVWGIVRPGTGHEVPVRLRGGTCYAIGAIASGDVPFSDLDLSLIDERGVMRAADVGPSPHPVVFDCPQHDETVKAVVRPSDLRRPSRFLLVLGRSSLPEAALP